MSLPRVLSIAGSDSGGGAGIQADLKTITVLGGFGMTVITALTAQNTTGVQGIFPVDPGFIGMQFDSVLTDIGADAAKTGMLATPEVIRLVAEKIRQYRIQKLVVDPVMAAKGGDPLIQEDARETMVSELIPLATVITPNRFEAEMISGIKIESIRDMERAAEEIVRRGARAVIVKNGQRDDESVDVLHDGSGIRHFVSPWYDTRNTHGSGCTYSAALATALAAGEELVSAVDIAKKYIAEAIKYSMNLGSGLGPTRHLPPGYKTGQFSGD